jgi:hypothetical protein
MERERDNQQEGDRQDEERGDASGSAREYRDYIPLPTNRRVDEGLAMQFFAYCDKHNQRYPAGENCPKCNLQVI